MAALPQRVLATFILATAIFSAKSASADEFDTLNVSGLRSVRYESNLFRLSEGANEHVLLGKSTRSDVITTTGVGIKLNKPYSLQRFELEANYVDNAYRNFDYLSFKGLNYSAAWRWSITPGFHGNLTSDRKKALNNFTDFFGFRSRNVNTNEGKRLDSVYEVDGAWRLTGGVSEVTVTNEQAVKEESDFSQRSGEVGVRYDFSSGSRASFISRNGRGSYLKRVQPVAGSLADTGFDEYRNELRFLWAISAKSSIDASLARLERKHDHFAQRDYGGTVGGVNLNWDFSAKSHFTAGWQRNLGSYQDANFSFVSTDLLSAGAIWRISPKTSLQLRYGTSLRDFLGTGTAHPPGPRRDRINTAAISFGWAPLREFSLDASLQSDRRSSTFSGLDFKNTSAFLTAQVSF